MKRFKRAINAEFPITTGIFLLIATIYCLCGPGRIDTIDSQWRFEVAYNIFNAHSVAINDPALLPLSPIGRDGHRYSIYGLAGSLLALPLITLADLVSPGNRDLAQFLFSFNTAIFSAGTAALLYGFYRSINVTPGAALLWTFVMSFTTLFLPLAASTFDQAQNAFFVLSSFYFADRARQTEKLTHAVLSGASFVVLIHYKEAYFALWPGLLCLAGLSTSKTPLEQLKTNTALRTLVLAGFLGIISWCIYNYIRFNQVTIPTGIARHPPYLGDNPALGFLGLTVSPGKGLLWYAPSVAIALLGWRRFSCNHDTLTKAVLLATSAWLALISSLTFYGGDWCWGPRYWVPILPLMFLAAPYAKITSNAAKAICGCVILASMLIQGMGIAVDHQKFLVARSQPAYFWYTDKAFYFKNSALLARPQEILELKDWNTKTSPIGFRPGPYPALITYTVFAPRTADELRHGETWMSQYPVFSLPKPWPIWSGAIDDANVAKVRAVSLAVLTLLGITGLFIFSIGWKRLTPARQALTR